MNEKSFLKELGSRILVCDGAFGTQLRKKIPSYVTCLDACNIDSDYLYIVQDIHREYKVVGVDIIQTNTFGANAKKLEFHGLDEQVREINAAGVRSSSVRKVCTTTEGGRCSYTRTTNSFAE